MARVRSSSSPHVRRATPSSTARSPARRPDISNRGGWVLIGRRSRARSASKAGAHLGPEVVIGFERRVGVHTIHGIAVPGGRQSGDRTRRPDDRELLEHLGFDQIAHFVPSSLPGHLMEFVLQVAPPMVLEHGTVGRRRTVKGELAADAGG